MKRRPKRPVPEENSAGSGNAILQVNVTTGSTSSTMSPMHQCEHIVAAIVNEAAILNTLGRSAEALAAYNSTGIHLAPAESRHDGPLSTPVHPLWRCRRQ